MALYGAALYGSCPYGEWECPAVGSMTLGVEIDWDEDSVFDGSNEDAWIVQNSFRTFRGRKHLIRSNGEGFQPQSIGTLLFELNNQDGRYDPLNAASPLYPNVGIDKYIKVTAVDHSTEIKYDVFNGIVDDVQAIEQGRKKTVIIRAVDGNDLLGRSKAYVDLTQNTDADTMLKALFDYIEWPAIWGTDILSGADTIPYSWISGQNANLAVDEIVESELGIFYIANDGKATFHSRHYVGAAPTLTLTATDVGQSLVIPQPWENKFDLVKIITYPKEKQALATLWTCYQEPYIDGSGGTLTLWADYTYDNRKVPAEGILCAATTDYTANTVEGGGGADITADIVLVKTDFGQTSKLVFTNNNAAGGYIAVKVRGEAIDTPETTPVQDGVEEGVVFELDNPWQQNINVSIDLSAFLVGFFAGNNRFPIIQIYSPVSAQLGYDLYEKIKLEIADLTIDAEYRIAGIAHEDYGFGRILTTWWLEPHMEVEGYWTFPAKMGEETIFAF